MESVNCNFCGSNRLGLYLEVREQRVHHSGQAFTIMKCSDCGLIFLNPRPTREEISQYYPTTYFDHFRHSHEVTSNPLKRLYRMVRYFHKRRQLKEKWRRVHRFVHHPGTVLDIGSNTGDFLNFMRHRQWEVAGVELSAEMCNFARSRFNITCFNGTLEQGAFPTEHFDVVTMWSTLEHTHGPLGTLKEVFRILKKGGLGVFLVPNIESFEARCFGSRWGHLDVPRHLYHFSPHTLTEMLTVCGFEVLDSSSLTSLEASTFKTRLNDFLTFSSASRKGALGYLLTVVWNSLATSMCNIITYPIDRIPAALGKGHSFLVSAKKPFSSTL